MKATIIRNGIGRGATSDIGVCIQCQDGFVKSASRGGYYDICQTCVDGWPPETPRAAAPAWRPTAANDN